MLLDVFNGDFNPVNFLTQMLLSLPAILLALSLHEAAHAYVAMRCGDPTAKMLGRVTINPLKHIDPVGFAMMFLVGVGWAKPVPVNPRNFKHDRRDDLLVSIAGVAANLLQFLVGCAILYWIIAFALHSLPTELRWGEGSFLATIGAREYAFTMEEAFMYPGSMHIYLITPVLGTAMGYVFQVVINYVVINLSLAAFNLLPVPPLDGYHVLNDLVLKGPLFAGGRVALMGRGLLYILAFSGWLGKGLGFIVGGALDGMGQLAYAAFHLLNPM